MDRTRCLLSLSFKINENDIWFIIVGSKDSATPTHFILSPRPMPRRKKRPRTNKESPSCQETSPRTILSSANRDHKKEKRHDIEGSLPGHPKKND